MSTDILPEILSELREMRSEQTDQRVLLERNTVTLEEVTRRAVLTEDRIKVVENHFAACPARNRAQADDNMWRLIKNWGVAAALIATIVTQLLPWLRGR